MNDPRVVWLCYRIEHETSVDYSKAEPVEYDEAAFGVRVEDGKARFTMKVHYASATEAKAEVEPYIHNWEFEVSLERGPNAFTLRFEHAHVVDLKPPPAEKGVVRLMTHFASGPATGSAHLTVISPYPPRPSGNIAISPDVRSMHFRYLDYRQRREPLPSMAYFCLTVVELSTRQRRNKRSAAAKKYRVSVDVFNMIGRLSSKKGGSKARKAEGVHDELSALEKRFLVASTKALIRRVAEVEFAPNAPLSELRLSDLPPV